MYCIGSCRIKLQWLPLHVHESNEVRAKLQKIEVKPKRHKLICNTVQDLANSGVVRGARGGIQSWAQVLRAH